MKRQANVFPKKPGLNEPGRANGRHCHQRRHDPGDAVEGSRDGGFFQPAFMGNIQQDSPEPLYRRWIETYGGEEFAEIVRAVLL